MADPKHIQKLIDSANEEPLPIASLKEGETAFTLRAKIVHMKTGEYRVALGSPCWTQSGGTVNIPIQRRGDAILTTSPPDSRPYSYSSGELGIDRGEESLPVRFVTSFD